MVHAAAVEPAISPMVVMLIIILSHGRNGQARKQQLLEDIFFTLFISEAHKLRASVSQGSYVAASGWQLCTALSWGNADLLKQIPAGPAICLCIYLIKLLEDLSESI